MNYFSAILSGVVTSILFVLVVPEEYLVLVWFIYLITFFGMLIFSTLEDIKDGIRK